jgi:hypothetical protein
MAKFEPNADQNRKIAKKAANVVDRSIAGGLDPEAVIKALQEIYFWKGGVPPVQAKASAAPTAREPKLFKRGDGSYGLKTTRLGLSDDHIVADFKAAGWGYINPAIRSNRRSEVPGKPEITTGTKRTLTIKNVVPSGEVWKFQKAVDTIGVPALAFDLEDLRNLVLGHEEELLKRGIRWVVAPAARFRNDDGYECVAYAVLGVRELDLVWVERVWGDSAWFGSSK